MEVGKRELIQSKGGLYIRLDDKQIPLIDLAQKMEVENSSVNKESVSVILVRLADRIAAFSVDAFQETVDIVSKTPGTQLVSLHGISGVTVLADSSLVLILDPGQFIESSAVEATESGAEKWPASVPHIAEFADEGHLRRVLVVDDSLVVRKVMQRDIEAMGLEVVTANDGNHALEVLEDSDVDIALVDIEMPNMNGYELLVRLREDARFQALPVIIITSRSGEQHRDKALHLGADDYITKPYDVSTLGHIMRKVTHRKAVKH